MDCWIHLCGMMGRILWWHVRSSNEFGIFKKGNNCPSFSLLLSSFVFLREFFATQRKTQGQGVFFIEEMIGYIVTTTVNIHNDTLIISTTLIMSQCIGLTNLTINRWSSLFFFSVFHHMYELKDCLSSHHSHDYNVYTP